MSGVPAAAGLPWIRSGSTERLTVAAALARLFLLVMPLVNVLGPNPWLAPPMVVASALLVWLTLVGRAYVDGVVIALLALALWCFLQWAWSATFISPKTLMHAIGVLGAIVAFYMGVRSGLLDLLRQGRELTIIRCVYKALFITSAFIVAEVVFTNVLGLNWNALVPYIQVPEFAALGPAGLMRPRGFASEPGIMALFYDFALFFIIPLLRYRRYRAGMFLLILPAYLLLLSAASILSCALVLMTLGAMRLWRRFGSTALMVLVFGTIAALVLAPYAKQLWEATDELVLTRLVALAAGTGSQSGLDRRLIYEQIAQVLATRPLGIGFGITAGLQDVGGIYLGTPLAPGQISLFGMFAMAGGLPAVLALVVIIGVLLCRVRVDPVYGGPIAAGGVAISLHQIFVTEYWLPFFWFFLAAASAFASTAHLRTAQRAISA
jgi:hypothetical protein